MTVGEGKPREVRWTWQSKDNDLRNGYMAVDGRVSLADLIALMAETAPGVALKDIEVNWATVVWSRPGTAEEIATRRAAEAAREQRHEEWERKMHAKLIAKYGTKVLP